MTNWKKNSSFLEIFTRSGMTLTQNDLTVWNMLSVDQRIFQSHIKAFLTNADMSESSKTAFVDNCKHYLDSEYNFLIALLPSRNNMEQMVSHSSNQVSFNFLTIDLSL